MNLGNYISPKLEKIMRDLNIVIHHWPECERVGDGTRAIWNVQPIKRGKKVRFVTADPGVIVGFDHSNRKEQYGRAQVIETSRKFFDRLNNIYDLKVYDSYPAVLREEDALKNVKERNIFKDQFNVDDNQRENWPTIKRSESDLYSRLELQGVVWGAKRDKKGFSFYTADEGLIANLKSKYFANLSFEPEDREKSPNIPLSKGKSNYFSVKLNTKNTKPEIIDEVHKYIMGDENVKSLDETPAIIRLEDAGYERQEGNKGNVYFTRSKFSGRDKQVNKSHTLQLKENFGDTSTRKNYEIGLQSVVDGSVSVLYQPIHIGEPNEAPTKRPESKLKTWVTAGVIGTTIAAGAVAYGTNFYGAKDTIDKMVQDLKGNQTTLVDPTTYKK